MKLEAEIAGQIHRVELDGADGKVDVVLDGRALEVDVRALEGFFASILVNGRAFEVTVEPEGEAWRVQVGIEAHHVTFLDPLRPTRRTPQGPGRAAGPKVVSSLMPGKIARVLVAAGDQVAEGQGLLVIEAMKMENEVTAPSAGRILALDVAPGETVEAGARLVTIG